VENALREVEGHGFDGTGVPRWFIEGWMDHALTNEEILFDRAARADLGAARSGGGDLRRDRSCSLDTNQHIDPWM
jgi:hypothetical protein